MKAAFHSELANRGVSNHPLCLAETQRQAQEQECFTVERAGETPALLALEALVWPSRGVHT